MLLKLKWISFLDVENNEKAISSAFFPISEYNVEDEAACCFDTVRHVSNALRILTLLQQGLPATGRKGERIPVPFPCFVFLKQSKDQLVHVTFHFICKQPFSPL